MSKRLRIRKFWKIIAFPFNVMGFLVAWALFDVSWREAWRGELE